MKIKPILKKLGDIKNTLLSAIGQDSLSDDELHDATIKLANIESTLTNGGESCAGVYVHQSQGEVDERDELECRISALTAFTGTDEFQELGDTERTRIANQLMHMNRYYHVLNHRVLNFPKKEEPVADDDDGQDDTGAEEDGTNAGSE